MSTLNGKAIIKIGLISLLIPRCSKNVFAHHRPGKSKIMMIEIKICPGLFHRRFQAIKITASEINKKKTWSILIPKPIQIARTYVRLIVQIHLFSSLPQVNHHSIIRIMKARIIPPQPTCSPTPGHHLVAVSTNKCPKLKSTFRKTAQK